MSRKAYESVEQTLASLGSTPEEVAHTLEATGVRGRRGSPLICPVGVYLAKHHDAVTPFEVCGDCCYFNFATSVVPVPAAVVAFVQNFDAGKYPHLELETTDEPIVTAG